MPESNINRIVLRKENGIAFLELSSPPKNEMNGEFFIHFNEIILQIALQTSLKGLIIKAEGRHFSSGANVEELVGLFSDSKDVPAEISENKQAFDGLQNFPFPVIACIKGICYGSGLELALSAHIRMGTANSLLCLPETSFGIIPGLSGIYNSCKCMGKAKSLAFVLGENTISGVDAVNDGLIDILADKHSLEAKAIKLIEQIYSGYKKELKVKYLLEFENNAE